MEIKINKEIRSYKETVYFGLTVRQSDLLAVGCGYSGRTAFSPCGAY